MSDKQYDIYLEEEYQKYLEREDDDVPVPTDEEYEEIIRTKDLVDYYKKQLGDLPNSPEDWDDFTKALFALWPWADH